MNREETKEAIKVMQHYVDGGEIQVKHKAEDNWLDIFPLEPLWNYDESDYRIKPTPKLRPYTFEEMCEAVKKHGVLVKDKENPSVFTIMCFNKENIVFNWNYHVTYEGFLKDNVWLDDGTPCGVIEEYFLR